MMRDDRHFLGETLDMFGFLLEIGQRDEQREIAVLVPRRLDPVVEKTLDPLPHAIAPGPDDHAAAHARFLGHVGFATTSWYQAAKSVRPDGLTRA